MIKVIFYHNMVAPYRHSLFHELSKKVDLQVWYSMLRTRDRKWSTTIPLLYKHIVLKNTTLYAFGRPFIYCPDLLRKLSNERPDAVISVLTRSNAADILRLSVFSKRRNIPLILFIGDIDRDGFDDGIPNSISYLFNWYKRTVLRLAKGYIYYSRLSKEWGEKQGALGPCTWGTQVLDGNQTPRLIVDRLGEKITCLYVGKLEHRKGVDLLPSALAKLGAGYLKNLNLRIIGDGPLVSIVDDLRALGLTVTHTEYLPREDLWEEYRNADFVLVPSRHDPWAFVANEAMAVGTPVLISRQAGAAEMVEGSGWVFDVNNQGSFVTAFEKAMTESRDRERREAAVSSERRYRPTHAAERIQNLIRTVQEAGVRI